MNRLAVRLIFFAWLAFSVASQVLSAPMLAPKQLLIVKPGIDKLHGTWLAAVINRSEKAESFRMPILLPKETEDFQPMEGLASGDVKIEMDGVYVEKVFAPGVNVISFAFVAPAQSGMTDLNLEAKLDLGELTVMTPRGMMQVQGERLVRSGTDVQDLQTYDLWVTKTPVMTGETIKVTVSGVPEGRSRLWILGAGFALILVFAAGSLTYWSHRISRREPNSGRVRAEI